MICVVNEGRIKCNAVLLDYAVRQLMLFLFYYFLKGDIFMEIAKHMKWSLLSLLPHSLPV